MPEAMMLVFSKAASPEQDAQYNQWYSEKHIRDLTRVPGIISATRYQLDKSVQPMPGIGGDHRTHLAVYEIEGDNPTDLKRFADNLVEALEQGVADISPHLDMVDISASFVLPVTERLLPKGGRRDPDKPKAMMMVFSRAVTPEQDAQYNQWYSEKHIHDLTHVPGIISATRYQLDKSVQPMPGIGGDHRTHLAVYEIEGDGPVDLKRFADNLVEALEQGVADISPHLDMVDISASFVLPITDRLVPEVSVV